MIGVFVVLEHGVFQDVFGSESPLQHGHCGGDALLPPKQTISFSLIFNSADNLRKWLDLSSFLLGEDTRIDGPFRTSSFSVVMSASCDVSCDGSSSCVSAIPFVSSSVSSALACNGIRPSCFSLVILACIVGFPLESFGNKEFSIITKFSYRSWR